MKRIAALCVRADSIYLAFRGVDCYGARRDARSYAGTFPVIAHPPCAQWGRLKGLAIYNATERDLGPFCAATVRQCGGVLEHPSASSLWDECAIPKPGATDAWGFTLSIPQAWFGHRADKATWFYVCGIPPADLIPLPVPVFNGSLPIESMSQREREATPPELAAWLVKMARLARPGRPATWKPSQVIETQESLFEDHDTMKRIL